jgi:uncharacterized protein (TIGR02118 family)
MKMVRLFKRKPGVTPEQFRELYEKEHVPLVLRLLPYFKGYTRKYIQHEPGYQIGSEVTYDVLTEVTFESKADYDHAQKALADPKIKDELYACECRFLDMTPGNRLGFFVDEEDTPQEMFKR